MFGTRRIQAIAIIAIVSLGLLPVTLRAQKDGKSKEPKPIPADARAVLWQEPTDITSRDLFLGSGGDADRKSTRLNSSHSQISYAVFCLKKKKNRRILSIMKKTNITINKIKI